MVALPPGFPEQHVEWLLGPFPDGSPEGMRRDDVAWSGAAAVCRASAERCEHVASGLGGSGGQYAETFVDNLRRSSARLHSQADHCESLAQQCREGANSIELAQLTWIAMGVVWAAQVTADLVLLFAGGAGAAKAVADRAVARAAWRTALGRIVDVIATGGLKASATRKAMLVGSTLVGGGIAGAVNLGAQWWQQARGHRTGTDFASAGLAAFTGAVGGGAGAAAAVKLAPMVGRAMGAIVDQDGPPLLPIVARLSGSTLLQAGSGLMGGAAGLVADTVARSAMNGNFTAPTGQELWNAAASGALGGIVGGATQAYGAARTASRTGVHIDAVLRDGYADRALQWPDSWVPRLNYEPADPRVTRIEMAARLSEMQEGTTEFAILRDQMAHVDGLSHEYWQRALQVHVLRSAIADPHRDPVGYAHALQRIEQAARDVDQVSRQAGFAGPRPLEDVDPGAVRQVTDEFGVHVVGGFDDPHREAFAIQVVNDLYGRRVLDSEALGPEHRHHFLSRRAALAHFRGDGESATVVLREIDPKHTNLAVPPELGGAAATAPQEAIAGRVVPGPLDTVSVWRRVDNGVFVEIDPSTYGLTTLNGPASGWAEVTAGVHAVALDGEGALITRNDGPIRDPHQIDELRYDQLHAKVPKSSGGHDAALDALAVTMGYDQPPTVARRDRIDAVLAHGGLELYLTREQAMALQRGTVDSYAPVQALRTTTPRTASDPKLVRVALRPDAVIVDEYRLQRLRQSEVNRAETAGGNLSDDLDHLVERIGLANRRTVLDHLDRLAVAHQYQAYVKPMVDYAGADFVVLDHTALVLPEIEPVPEIAAPVVTENAIAAARPDPPTDESLPIADMLDEFGPVGSLRATFAFEQLVGSGNGSRWKLTEVNPVTAVDRDRMLGRFEWLDAERQVWDREAVGYSAKFTFYNESARSADPNPVGAMTVYAYRDDLGSRVVFVEPARTGNSAFEPAFVLRIHAMLAHPESGAHRLEVRARGNDPALTDILDWDQTPGRWAKTSESIRTSIAAEWLRSMPDDHQRTLMDLERWLDDGSFAQRLTPRALAELGAGPRERRLGTILTQFLNWNGVCQYRVSPR